MLPLGTSAQPEITSGRKQLVVFLSDFVGASLLVFCAAVLCSALFCRGLVLPDLSCVEDPVCTVLG